MPDVTQFTKLGFRLTGITSDARIATDTVDIFIQPLANVVRVVGSSQSENNAKANFTIRLDKPAAQTTVLTYRTADGTVLAGSDYIAQASSVTFAPGEQEKIISVALLNDTTREKGEYFILQVTNTETDTPFSVRGVAVIRESEQAPIITTQKPTLSFADTLQENLPDKSGQVRVQVA